MLRSSPQGIYRSVIIEVIDCKIHKAIPEMIYAQMIGGVIAGMIREKVKDSTTMAFAVKLRERPQMFTGKTNNGAIGMISTEREIATISTEMIAGVIASVMSAGGLNT